MARREAPRTRKRYVTTTKDAPLGAPSPRFCEGQGLEDGLPGAAKNTGGLARPLLSYAHKWGRDKTNRELLYGFLFGYIRALFRSG